VCEISTSETSEAETSEGSNLERILAALQVPFPELTDLRLSSRYQPFPIRSWVDPPTSLVVSHSISGFTETTFVCYSPPHSTIDPIYLPHTKDDPEDAASVELSSISSLTSDKYEELKVEIPCSELDWQVSSMELHIYGNLHYRQHWQVNVENVLWLRLLHPFTSVKNLYLSEEIARRNVPTLQELVGGRATEVLPTLENIFWRRASDRDLSRRAFSRSLL
jgi:hypothetical protein